MKKLLIKLGLLMALPLTALQTSAAVPAYDMEAAKANAQADFANWMKYLPDDVFVAHVSIPGTHDTATGHGFQTSGLTGATSSQTQNTTIEQQLAGGVRAFDLRPGTSGGTLYCTHGVAVTKYTMEYVLDTLTQYLEDHPGEFFIIHLFKGNVDSANDTFNKLIDDCFNKKYADYIIDYNPRLKVKDVRKHIVLLRRDRLDFVNFEKAGNLGYWPWDTDIWTENHERLSTPVTNASDPTIKGVVRVSDISKFPKDDSDIKLTIDDKKTAVTNLYNWCKNQPTPNSTKNILYKPDWTITFTSGEYVGVSSTIGYKGGRRGYAWTAEQMNPYYTDLILTSKEKGPCGILFSDWVLIDSYTHDNAGYAQDFTFRKEGKDLVSTVAYNNFDYIGDYILDDEYFNENIVLPENIWEEGKEYFLRNVGTGELLTAGATWGTRAALSGEEGLPVTLAFDDSNGNYQIRTTLGSNGMGWDGQGYFMDWWDANNLEKFTVERVSAGKFCFKSVSSGLALGAFSVNDDTYKAGDPAVPVPLPYADGTNYLAHRVAYNKEDPMQQWEVIAVDDYYEADLNRASYKKGIDIAYYAARGHKFIPGDTYNWTGTTKSSGNYNSSISHVGTNSSNDKNLLLHLTHTTYKYSYQKCSWSLSHSIQIPKEGKYKLRFKTGHNSMTLNNNTFVYKVNGTDIRSKLQSVGSNDAAEAIKKFRENPGTYTMELDYNFDAPSEIKFEMSYGGGQTVTSIYLDDIELIYYGPDPTKRYVVLVRAMADAKRRLTEMSKTMAGVSVNSINFTTYENGMLSNAYAGQGEEQAQEIYEELRKLTYKQTPDDNNHHQDYTNALINAGFETGTMMGWETSYEGLTGVDTGVKPNEGVYVTNPSDDEEVEEKPDLQAYLFNCWQEDPGPDYRGRGVILSQTIPNLPSGHYTVMAQAANDENNYMFIEVNGQRSEAIPVPPGENVSKWISFDFEVAENTDAVTISFMGGNTDGTFDDFGGNWYKIDDVRLYRSDAVNECVFFNRLIEAADRADEIARETFTEEYYKKWSASDGRTAFENLIASHRENGDHSADLSGSNGLPERDALFTSLSQFALAQKYTGANMSAAIRNNSFELTDLTYWHTQAAPISTSLIEKTGEGDFNIATRHLNNIYYTKHEHEGYAHAYPIYQTISGVPKGHYTLSAMVASDKDNQFYLAVNDKPSEVCTTTDPKTFQPIYMEFEVTDENGEDIRIGLFPSKSGSFSAELEPEVDNLGPWYAVDNFELKLVGRKMSIDWTMETPTHGTIILPFDVSATDLEKKGLEIYSLNHHEEATAQGATHKILVYEHQDEIKANTPYIVMVAGQAVPVAKGVKVKAASADENVTGLTYTFEGITSNKADEYKEPYQDGALTGVLVPTPADESQYHLQSYDDNIGFILHKDGPHDDLAVEPYHAYITLPEESQGDVNIHGLYFEEPSLPLEWMMEGNHYGTIILPFEVAKEDMPAGLVVRKITGVSTSRNAITHTYQIAQLGEAEESMEANVPYLVYSENPVKDAITFRGIATNKENEYLEGVLKGLLQKHDIEDGSALPKGYWVLYEEEDGTAYFEMLGDNSKLSANHAYIFNPNSVTDEPVETASAKSVKLMAEEPTPSADVILLSEDQAEQTYPWQMDNEFVGTIVMPFDVDASVLSENDLEAYKIESAGTMQTKNGVTYHILNRVPETEGLKANMAYMLTPSGEVPNKIEFTGAPDAKTLELNGLMLGTYDEATAPENSYVANAEKGLDFKKVGADGAPVAKLHAYIPAASDLTGTYLVVNDDTVDVTEIMEGEVNVDIYTLDGVMVRRDVKAAEALQELDHGIYILRSAKGTVKVIK